MSGRESDGQKGRSRRVRFWEGVLALKTNEISVRNNFAWEVNGERGAEKWRCGGRENGKEKVACCSFSSRTTFLRVESQLWYTVLFD